jgi:hypothetical protein
VIFTQTVKKGKALSIVKRRIHDLSPFL